MDLRQMREDKTQGEAGTRVNYDYSGARSLFTSTARKSEKFEPPYKEAILDADDEWGDPALWQAMRGCGRSPIRSISTSPLLILAATRTARSSLSTRTARSTSSCSGRTLILSALITATTLILGFPIAHLLAVLPLRYSNLLMIFVLLPFWTSLLVRTTSWIVLLQSQGVVNRSVGRDRV